MKRCTLDDPRFSVQVSKFIDGIWTEFETILTSTKEGAEGFYNASSKLDSDLKRYRIVADRTDRERWGM